MFTDVEIRVLGCLMEKEMATPDYYPLSLNSLINACNQKSNRLPVVSYNEDEVTQALNSLLDKQLVLQSAAGRVVKYEQRFSYNNGLSVQDAALMCSLFVRGPQTAGELRGHTARLAEFENLVEIKKVLAGLIEMDMLTLLAREPGRKEARYAHLFADNSSGQENPPEKRKAMSHDKDESFTLLQHEVAALKEELRDLQLEFSEFKKQFE